MANLCKCAVFKCTLGRTWASIESRFLVREKPWFNQGILRTQLYIDWQILTQYATRPSRVLPTGHLWTHILQTVMVTVHVAILPFGSVADWHYGTFWASSYCVVCYSARLPWLHWYVASSKSDTLFILIYMQSVFCCLCFYVSMFLCQIYLRSQGASQLTR